MPRRGSAWPLVVRQLVLVLRWHGTGAPTPSDRVRGPVSVTCDLRECVTIFARRDNAHSFFDNAHSFFVCYFRLFPFSLTDTWGRILRSAHAMQERMPRPRRPIDGVGCGDTDGARRDHQHHTPEQ